MALLETDYAHYVTNHADGSASLDFILYDVDCAACFIDIEHALAHAKGLISARVNVTYNRLHVEFEPQKITAAAMLALLVAKGYRAKPFRINEQEEYERNRSQYLIKCLAVAAFAALNIMLLSMSIWTGSGDDLSPETRDFFHWLSALIALPAAAYAGQPFFKNALDGLCHGRWNMDVPISLGICLALGMSVYETAQHGEHAYFDSAIMLLAFLLFGRVMEQAMRRRTRAAAGNIAALKGEIAYRRGDDGTIVPVPVAALEVNDHIIVRAGERVPADGVVLSGTSMVDESIITGETRPRAVATDAMIYAGALNLDGTLQMRVMGAGQSTLLDDIGHLVEQAGAARSHYQRLADRAARLYAPMVHAAAFLTAIGWLALGADMHTALVIAISVLIITCPCALALAVPAVQVVAAGRLFHAGLFLNTPEALERLAQIDYIVFDKTGTLTRPEPSIINQAELAPHIMEVAAFLARNSHHPLAQAVAQSLPPSSATYAVKEISGQGVEAQVGDEIWRLGSADFCSIPTPLRDAGAFHSVLYVRRGDDVAALHVAQNLRSDAQDVIAALQARGFSLAILSGDHHDAVASCSQHVGIAQWQAGLKPAQKIAQLEALSAQGHKVLMVGDGLNDAPALAAAHASLSPITAVDLAQAQADAVFLGEPLRPVRDALDVARFARRLMQENLLLAVVYNMIAVPLAIAGYVTPLIAALAMSGSSLLVTLNALRIHTTGLTFGARANKSAAPYVGPIAKVDV